MSLSSEEKLKRLEKALEYGGNTHTVSDVVELIRAEKAQFWSWKDGNIITELHNFPRMKAVHFWLLSGDLKDCLALEEDVLSWAHQQKCTMATACGRRGWERAAASAGWKPQPQMFNFYKPLSP